jgi:hypothetical protein
LVFAAFFVAPFVPSTNFWFQNGSGVPGAGSGIVGAPDEEEVKRERERRERERESRQRERERKTLHSKPAERPHDSHRKGRCCTWMRARELGLGARVTPRTATSTRVRDESATRPGKMYVCRFARGCGLFGCALESAVFQSTHIYIITNCRRRMRVMRAPGLGSRGEWCKSKCVRE